MGVDRETRKSTMWEKEVLGQEMKTTGYVQLENSVSFIADCRTQPTVGGAIPSAAEEWRTGGKGQAGKGETGISIKTILRTT